jgi:nucleotide-binding universal stress UspA family protein
MKAKILMPLENSANSLRAVKYVAKAMKPTAQITMLTVIPDPSPACDFDSGAVMQHFTDNLDVFCKIEETHKSTMQWFMKEAKKVLVKAGFSPKDIAIRIRKKKAGVARDIVKEAEKGKYDTVIMGRRGFAGVNRFLFGSVSHKVMQLAKNVSVTLVN